MTTIAQRIKQIRKDAKMTQKQFSEVVDVGWVAVAGWEQGKIKPGDGRLYVIADRFKVNPEWLVNGTGDVYRSDADNDVTRSRIEIDVIKSLFQSLPLDYQNKILTALREIATADATKHGETL